MPNTTAKQLKDLVNATLKDDVLGFASDEQYSAEFISTGVLPIDVLWQGGVPRGRFIELYGDYSTLKSYVGLMSIASFQRQGKVCAIIDTEHSFDSDWARSCGVDVDELIIQRPETGELAMDTAETLIRGGCDLIVFDSVAAMTPQAEQSKRLHGESIQPARIAMLMSAALRRLTTANKTCSMIFINQMRVNIGITFGSNEALPGGKALPYYSSYRTHFRKVGKITRPRKAFDGEAWVNTKDIIGQKFKVELTKSKLSKPFVEQHFTWSLEKGALDLIGYLIAQGIETGLVSQKGNTWSYGSVKAVGRENFRNKLEENDTAALELENEIRAFHGIPEVQSRTTWDQTTTAATKPPSRSRGRSGPVKKSAGKLRKR